jgi:DNA-binding winged helix-turn-helix (wHTH) protein
VKIRFDDMVLDVGARQLRRGDEDVHLSRKGFDLLAALVQARPRALSKTDLHALLWPDIYVSDANLAMLAAEVRRALGDAARTPRFIRTVQRFGYAFQGDATDLTDVLSPEATGVGPRNWLIASLRQIPLVPGENLVGRDPGVQVWLDARGVSRRHARIMVDGDRVQLEDLDSKNGTRVCGERIAGPVPLTDGNEIRFGSVTVTFRSRIEAEATRTERED